jgi:hypothetical protein
LIGAGINYFLALPAAMSLADFVVPGFVMNLALCEYVGFALLAIWAFTNSTAAVLAVAALVAVDSMVGVLMLNKSWALLPWFAFVIGALSYNLTILRLATAGLLIVFAFSVLQPLVAYGRNEANNNSGVSLTFRAKWANEAATYERVEVRRPLDRTLRA